MKKEEKGFWKFLGWQEWTVVVTACVLATGVAAILSPTFRALMASDSFAAWVQALGSVAAIGVAIALSRHQSSISLKVQQTEWDRLRQEKNQQHEERLQAIRETTVLAIEAVINICKEIESQDLPSAEQAKVYIRPIQVCTDILDKLAIHESPGVSLAPNVLNAKLRTRECLSALETICMTSDLDGLWAQKSTIKELGLDAEEILHSLNAAAARYESPGELAAG